MYDLMNASKLARIASEEGTMTYITARIAAHTTQGLQSLQLGR